MPFFLICQHCASLVSLSDGLRPKEETPDQRHSRTTTEAKEETETRIQSGPHANPAERYSDKDPSALQVFGSVTRKPAIYIEHFATALFPYLCVDII